MIAEERKIKLVANWIFLGVGMLIIQVLLGGITRLTGSGLSITEWKPIMGTLPPLNETEWQQAFTKYQQIAQYKYLNSGFTLSNFKFIFFWEWFHRLWARFVGVVFLIPFVIFWVKGYFKKWMINPLIILFLMGALQGAIGWIMVASGLNDTNLYVSHIKLALHFVSAMVLISYALIFGLMLVVKPQQRVVNASLKKWLIGLMVLLTIQLFYGAFMAGLKAANAAPTWPTINGVFFPRVWGNIFHDTLTIHFIHRTMAYIIALLVFFWWVKAKSITTSAAFFIVRPWPLVLVIFQIVLGIFTLLTSTHKVIGRFGSFEWMALFHQLLGMLLLLSLIAAAYILRFKKN